MNVLPSSVRIFLIMLLTLLGAAIVFAQPAFAGARWA